ncbi:uncharacterized protein BDZ99DRAFT_417287 [Mytilinidion resinicola]|uniref:3-hydroxyisobutyrate dehydrogenase n=1 Tax=Mytilinidion resinicola TaxID=574789 RepID=A0A6A6YN25_9PEZI|nr:uncharacterized protein BDZ99DRAFT_417287 [Mytilinidion resinicola]KAF2809404.1 hypothetical protein BDZ99DRAFT_417287 [Mytilinidion resinicola]
MDFTNKSIGFVGLGVMGYPMVENLVKKLPQSVNVYVFDVVTQPMHMLSSQSNGKVEACGSAKGVAEKADIILTMLPEGSHVRSVYLTPDTGILSANINGKLLIDCSTIDTATSLAVASSIREKDASIAFYDAPVSGGNLGAQNATLTFMVGCAPDDVRFAGIQHLLAMMGTSVFACGGQSLGLTAKLCNNYCSGLIAIATAEAMNMGIKSGMSPRVLADIFHTSTAQSTICDKWNPVPGICPEAPASKGYAGGFKVQLMRKDFMLAVDSAKRVGATLTLGEAGLETYTAAMNDERCRDLDSRVVFRYIGGDEDWATGKAFGGSGQQ